MCQTTPRRTYIMFFIGHNIAVVFCKLIYEKMKKQKELSSKKLIPLLLKFLKHQLNKVSVSTPMLIAISVSTELNRFIMIHPFI